MEQSEGMVMMMGKKSEEKGRAQRHGEAGWSRVKAG